jgi:hypothetical protein
MPMHRIRRKATARRPAFLRFALAFAAFLTAFNYLSALAHLTFVAHTTCAEHSALAHIPNASSAAAEVGPNTVAPSGGSLAADEHDHCIAGVARPGEAEVAAAALSAVVCADPPVVAPLVLQKPCPVRAAPAPPIDILFLSPKSSPPL